MKQSDATSSNCDKMRTSFTLDSVWLQMGNSKSDQSKRLAHLIHRVMLYIRLQAAWLGFLTC